MLLSAICISLAADDTTTAADTTTTTQELIPCEFECPEENGYFEYEPCGTLFCNCANGIGYEQVKITRKLSILSSKTFPRSVTRVWSSTLWRSAAPSRRTTRTANFN